MIQTLSAEGSVVREDHFVLSIDPREQANGLEILLPRIGDVFGDWDLCLDRVAASGAREANQG